MGIFDNLNKESGHFFEIRYKIDGITYTEKVYGNVAKANAEVKKIKSDAEKRKGKFQHLSTKLKTK